MFLTADPQVTSLTCTQSSRKLTTMKTKLSQPLLRSQILQRMIQTAFFIVVSINSEDAQMISHDSRESLELPSPQRNPSNSLATPTTAAEHPGFYGVMLVLWLGQS